MQYRFREHMMKTFQKYAELTYKLRPKTSSFNDLLTHLNANDGLLTSKQGT